MVPALLTKVIKASHHTSLDNPLNESIKSEAKRS